MNLTKRRSSVYRKLSTETWLPLIRYLGIGGFVFFLDTGTFQFLIKAGIFRPLATTIAYLLAVIAHFTCNKFLNFRSFERSTLRQLRTYLVVVCFFWIVTLLTIELGVRGFGLLPLWAKILAITINIPTGYLGHRYLTFSGGIGAAWRRWQKSLRRS